MKYIFSGCMFAGFVLAAYFAVSFFWSKEKKYLENRLLAVFCFSSAVWSLGFGALILQTDTDVAYLCRCVGMIGVFLYLITAQILVCHISGIPHTIRYTINGISFMGIFVYFLVIQKSQVVYHLEKMGMTYYFKPGFCNNIYTAYSIIIAFQIFVVTIYMIRCSTLKRIRAFGRKFLLVETLILLGMMLDTVFPLIGIAAIPGSSLTQFWGMIVLYNAVNVISRSRINITNMSEFIYYSMATPVLVYDSDRRIQIMNDEAVSFLKTDREKIAQENIPLDQIFDVGEEGLFTFPEKSKGVDALCRNNQLYCNLAINKINDNYGDIIGYIIIVTDLSERMKTVQRLEEAMEEAKAANKAKSTFLANMSHEIRTPMNAIIGFSELVLKMDIDEQVQEYVEDIKGSSYNLLAIINDILDISKIESGKMELVCQEYYTASLFNDVYLIIHTQAEKKGLEFNMAIDPDIPNKLSGDKIRIRGVLINLLNNAVKYTMEGSVSFEAKCLSRQGKEAVLEFKVSDTGIGIKEEEQGRLFESFSQVDRKMHYGVEGSGLGLAIAKGYVTLMGGDITVDSVYGKGSVFTAVIHQKVIDTSPLDESYAREDEEMDEFSMGTMKITGVRVLLVDDNPVNLKVAEGSLRHYGMEVDMAASGEEAVALCQKEHYPLVFMDQMMPQMDGIEAMTHIRKIDPYYDFGGRCKIIVLTANAISGARQELMAKGFDEYLEKPMNFKHLEQLLAAFLPKECIQIQTENQEEQSENIFEAEDITLLQDMLPKVEIKRGILNCGGNLEEYLKILQLTFRDGKKQLEELKNLQKKGNYSDYTIKIHALKGMALGVGAGWIADLARLQEQAGKNGEFGYIDAHMEEFLHEYELLLEQMREVLEKYQMMEGETEKKEILKKEDILQVLREIKQCMDGFDFAGAARLIREAKVCQLSEQDRKMLEQIGQWVDEAETDKIQELIESPIYMPDK